MTPQRKGIVHPDDIARLERAKRLDRETRDLYVQAVVLAMMNGGSYAEVSKVTGQSTNTLQRWVREAGVTVGGQKDRLRTQEEVDEFDARLRAAEAALRSIRGGLSQD